jgi:dipeptidyl aminopeptidase/acylaminoacyl peptidase
MTHNPDVLERLAPLSGAPGRSFEDLLRLRAKRQRARKIGAIAVVAALLVALVSVGLAIDDRSEPGPANPPAKSHAGTFTGMVIRQDRQRGLVAEDPSTDEAITLAAASDFRHHRIAWAAASADGRWAAFESPFCQDGSADWEGKSGLWVTNGIDKPRQLTAPCVEFPEGPTFEGDWAWSPTGSRLAVVEGDHLILIDPATGERTDLGKPAGDASSLAWSPDETQIAYTTVPSGSPNGNSPHASVYAVRVDGGEQALIAESLGQVPTGEEGRGIQWSPDGTRIAVLADAGTPTLYVMNADGSERRPLAEGALIAHGLGSPNPVWSPDGTRIAYATFSAAHDKAQIWSTSPDGSIPVLVFSPTSAPPEDTAVGGPIWSPDGTHIAFRYDSHSSQREYLIANADGTGSVHAIGELKYRRWRGGWYFCECYG